MEESFDFRQEIRIDPLNLAEEVLDQGRKMMAMIHAYARATQARDRAKLRVEVIYASLLLKVRKNPGEYGFNKDNKPTDVAVNAAVMIQPQYLKARQRLINLQKECEILKPGVDAFKDRSIQIGRLIQLHLSGYYGQEAKVPAQARHDIDESAEHGQRALLRHSPRMQSLKEQV